jgi:hypothetical protein
MLAGENFDICNHLMATATRDGDERWQKLNVY